MSRGQQPHIWLSGPDPIAHEQHIAWHRARAQAHFRNEQWDITYKQYQKIWGDQWHRRGRGVDDLLMMRKNHLKPWTTRNVTLATRSEFHKKQWEIKRYNQAQRLKETQ